ncbi:MAG: hypothetical protein RL038_975 [Actinomycetota bacterium]
MRILICPDSFGGTLSALEASNAIQEGWSSKFPETEFIQRPLTDGGAGFVACMYSALGGEIFSTTVTGAFGEQLPVTWLKVGNRAFFEVAQICGLTDSPKTSKAAMRASSFGVGELLKMLVSDSSIFEISIGLGGSSVSDGGIGLLAALGAKSNVELRGGAAVLSEIEEIDLSPIKLPESIKINFFADVEVPLTGKRGAALGFASQKGAIAADVEVIEKGLENLTQVLGRTADGKNPAVVMGAGAAGGIGYALLWLGAEFKPGITSVISEMKLGEDFAKADLIVTGEGKLDWQSEVGKVISGVADLARESAKPVLALVGQNDLSMRELQNLGIHGVYAAAEIASLEMSLSKPYETLKQTAARAARTWGTRKD